MPNLPPGQIETRRFPIVGERAHLQRSIRGADLAGADLSGSDLEGADFSNADLIGANVSGTALSATRFGGGAVAGAKFDGAWGLAEDQAFYLESQGVNLQRQ